MKYPGFRSQNRQIFLMDAQGKDISFERWRITLYYHPNYAATHFLQSEAEYNEFLKKYQPYCYSDYQEFRTDYEKEGINNGQDTI